MSPKKVKSKSAKLLTDVELELMGILWRLQEGTVAEVIQCLPADRKLAYTSVSTMLRILEQKNVVSSRKEGRGHVYIPTLEKERYEGVSLNHLVNRVFDGTPASLVRRLIKDKALTAEDLSELKALLNERTK